MNGHFYCFDTWIQRKTKLCMICMLQYSENIFSNKKVYFDLHEINIALRRPKQFDVDR